MKCNFCNRELPGGSVFCPYCGKKTTPPETFCNQCGTKLAGDFKFCTKCGAPVVAANSSANAENNTRGDVRFTSTMGSSSNMGANVPPTHNSGAAVSCYVDIDYRYGKGSGLFSQTTGRFQLSGNVVTFTPKIGKKHVHTFNVYDVVDTQFSSATAIHLFPEYTVYLRSGEKFNYFYSPVVKNKLIEVDSVIRSMIGK